MSWFGSPVLILVVAVVEFLPLKNKILSGRVAIRQLTGLKEEHQQIMYETMLKVSS